MSESVTLSFGDMEGGWFGFASNARLAVLFRGRELLEVSDEAALSMTVDVPFERWSVAWEGADCGFEVVAAAVSAPVQRESGSEQLVAVNGTVRAGGDSKPIDALGQMSTSSVDTSAPLVRSVGAWFDGGGIVLESRRSAKSSDHGSEQVWAVLVESGEPVPVVDPRLSTTYDGDGHQRRAGLELWMTEEEGYPVRAAGEVICGSSLDLGDSQLDLAFFRWHAQGAHGVGRYDILRKLQT